jgi:hypothetical protein
MRGKTGTMFDAIKPLFLYGGDKRAVHDQSSAGIAVVSVNSE